MNRVDGSCDGSSDCVIDLHIKILMDMPHRDGLDLITILQKKNKLMNFKKHPQDRMIH